MVTGKQLKAAILARRTAQGPRKKRTRPEPRQRTVADLERAGDQVGRRSAESTTTAVQSQQRTRRVRAGAARTVRHRVLLGAQDCQHSLPCPRG
jgi:hypothetical protein